MKPLVSAITYNTVEGLNATLGLKWEHQQNEDKAYGVELLNRYGFSNTHYNALLRLGYAVQDPKWKGRTWKIGLQGGQYIYQLNNNDPITPLINEAYTLFGGQNYMKLYEARLGRLNIARNWGNGLKASLGLAYEQRMPLENTSSYTFSDKHKANLSPNQPANLPAFEEHKAAVINASVSYQPGWKYTQYPKYKSPHSSNAPVFTARYTKGIPGIFDSKSDFDKWSVDIEHQVRLPQPPAGFRRADAARPHRFGRDRHSARRAGGDAAGIMGRPSLPCHDDGRRVVARVLHRPRCWSMSSTSRLGWSPAPLGRLDVFYSAPPTVTGFYLIDTLIARDFEAFRSALSQLILPATTLAIFSLAPIARMTRASMLAVLSSEFVRTARASGLSPSTVIVTYAFRNAMLPVITTLSMVFSFLLGANVLVEKVFAWPGIGSYAVEALISSDFAPVQGFVLTMAVMYVLLNLVIDILYGVIDPRVRLEG